MSKKEKETAQDNGQIVTYKGTEYKTSEWTEIQVDDYNHVADLEIKIHRAAFNIRQLNGGLEFYKNKLDESLISESEEKVEAEAEA